MLDLCDAAAAEIVHIVDNLTVEYPTTSPDENVRTTSREPIAHAVLYPIFLAASMSVLCLKLRRPSVGADIQDVSDVKVTGSRDEDMELATAVAKEEGLTMTPLRKLQRLLHPICSQIDVANVITRPLGEIQATNDIATATTTKTEMSHQHVTDSGCSMDVGTPMLNAASAQQQQQQQRMMMRAPPRHNEQLWPATTTADLDHSTALIEDQAFYSDSMTSRGMVHVMSRRNDIDREQLEKLSHKRDLHYTTAVTSTLSSSMDVFGVYPAAPPAPPLPVSSMYFGNTSKQVTMQQQQAIPTTLHHHHHNFSGQKRQHPLQQQQHQQQQQLQQQYQTKRIRGHSTSSYESMMPMTYLRGGTAAAAAAAAAISPTTPRRFSYGSSTGTNMTEYPDQVAFNMYSDDYLQLMDMSEPPSTPEPVLTAAAAAAAAAAGGGGGSMAPSSSTVVANGMSSSNSSPAMFSMGPPAAAATATTTTTNNSTPLLPKPNPKKRAQTVRKSWAGQQKETEPFHGSMMETLHTGAAGAAGHTSNTAAAAAAMMDSFLSSTASTSPTVTATNTEQQQQQQSSTLTNDDNNNMWYFLESARFAQAPTAAATPAAPTPTPTASWPSSTRSNSRQQRQVYHHHHHHHQHAKARHHYPPRQPTPSSSSSSAAMLNQDSWIALSPHTTSKVDPSDQDMLNATFE